MGSGLDFLLRANPSVLPHDTPPRVVNHDERSRPQRDFSPAGSTLATPTTAWRTVRGIEMMHALRKGQARWMAKGDVGGQTRLIHKVFGLAV